MQKTFRKMREEKKEKTYSKLVAGFILCELVVFFFLITTVLFPSVNGVLAVVGQDNVTVTTNLTVGNVFPEILNVTINNGNDIDLTPNDTTYVETIVIIRDYNGEGDIFNLSLELFDTVASSLGDADDNNHHYSNTTCAIDYSYGNAFEVLGNCSVNLEYYANNQSWNGSALVYDNASLSALGSNSTTVNSLLALGLPDNIDYGTVNATEVSDQQIANITNYGNTIFNVSISGYAFTEGDGNAMNCTLGSLRNISVEYEQYNLTASNASDLTLGQMDGQYINLSSSPVVNLFNLAHRQNDVTNEATNESYWRIYVPVGVAGSCTGNLIFGSVQSAAV